MGNIRFCKVSKNYINYLHNVDGRVPIKKDRPYIMLAIKINNHNYVVPLTSQTDTIRQTTGRSRRNSLTTVSIKEENGNIIADILINNMYAAPLSEITFINKITDPYMIKESRFVRKNQDVITKKAQNVYNLRYKTEDTRYRLLNKICCDFMLLEKYCDLWK